MFHLYSPIFFLQMFCLYHAYQNHRSDTKWYFIIMFVPVLGSLFYLYSNFYSRRNVENISEGFKTAFVSNYLIDKLEKQLRFSDTVKNRIELAQEHSLVGNYERALELLNNSLKGLHSDDVDLIKLIVKNYYLDGNYAKAVEYGKKLDADKSFNKSQEKIAYAWSYYYLNDLVSAEKAFLELNVRFSNYSHRYEFAEFYNRIDKPTKALEVLNELLDEIDAMDSYEKRLIKQTHKDIVQLYKKLIK